MDVAVREVRLGPEDVVVEERPGGVCYVRSPHALGPYPDKMTARLDHWADAVPDRVFLAERGPDGDWRRLTYAETRRRVRAIAAALIARGLSPERPVVILSGNDLEHALLGLAAQYAGIPYAPISPPYSLVSSDYGKLRHIIDLLTPGLVFAASGRAFGPAIAAVVPPDTEVVVTRDPPSGRTATAFADLLGDGDGAAVDAAHDAVGPDTIAKFLFTSGSTGWPKGVINPQRMLCSNMEMVSSAFTYLKDEPPVLLDWSPWNHTAGGNHNFNLALYNGGTLHLDEGKPTPDGIHATVRNLRDVSPNWYFNVPRGYDALIPFLRADKALRESLFRDCKVLYYAGAGVAQHTWDALDELAVATLGKRVLLLSGLGSTETGPFALCLLHEEKRAGHVGVPAPGVELKLVPNEGKLEARVKSPSVMPGYWRQPELTEGAFDEEGFYKFGDALKFSDRSDPRKGFVFDGRVTEDFKLLTGTWVSVGPLRAGFIDHFAPLVKDVVLTGIDKDYVGALVFPDLDSCRALANGLAPDCNVAAVLADPAVRAAFKAKLDAFAARATGSSNRVRRLVVMAAPAAIDAHEVTDKGSINQRAVLTARAPLVEALYADPAPADVIETG